ncbi:MAG TPA: substrate-binding domain-containing protein [Terriglobales bacterium]|nr:substrate-binding domain-containing protein [Terriglobales bacterium]
MEKLHFAVALPSQNEYQRMQAANAVEAGNQLGIEVSVFYADSDAIQQSQQVLDLIQRSKNKPDGILLEPLTAVGLERAAQAAHDAGIGWVVLNADVDYVPRLRQAGKAPIFVVTRDHIEIGRVQGRQFVALLPGGGSVLYIQGPANSSAAAQRTTGMESTKPASIHIKTLRSQWNEADAYKTISAWLRLPTNRAADFNLVGCQYDGIAMGARRAFEEHENHEERIRWLALPLSGVDGLPTQGKAWVKQGLLTATVEAPTTTQLGVRLLEQAIRTGKSPAERTLIDVHSYPGLDELTPRATR